MNGLIDSADLVGSQEEAMQYREALKAIETCGLALGALRVIVEHPKNPESLAHAKRVYEHLTSGKTPLEPQDLQPA